LFKFLLSKQYPPKKENTRKGNGNEKTEDSLQVISC
jgi:hypothetical protein